MCGNSTKFDNIYSGYSKYCSQSCASKTSAINQWKDAEDRKCNLSKLTTIRNKQGSFGKGRTKGAKNKNPYPKTELFYRKMQNLNNILAQRNHWHNINTIWWETSSEDDKILRIKKMMNTKKI